MQYKAQFGKNIYDNTSDYCTLGNCDAIKFSLCRFDQIEVEKLFALAMPHYNIFELHYYLRTTHNFSQLSISNNPTIKENILTLSTEF